jgi:hypothetical protein
VNSKATTTKEPRALVVQRFILKGSQATHLLPLLDKAYQRAPRVFGPTKGKEITLVRDGREKVGLRFVGKAFEITISGLKLSGLPEFELPVSGVNYLFR